MSGRGGETALPMMVPLKVVTFMGRGKVGERDHGTRRASGFRARAGGGEPVDSEDREGFAATRGNK